MFLLPINARFEALVTSKMPGSPGILSKGVKYVMIGEMSMAGMRQLSLVQKRCQEIFLDRSELYFEGLSVILAGDFFQLPLVRQTALFSRKREVKRRATVGGYIKH